MKLREESTCEGGSDWVQSGAELGVGTAILAVRSFNVWRRNLASTAPPLAELVDSSVENAAARAAAVSSEIAELLDGSAAWVPSPAQPVVSTLQEVSAAVPDLLRIAGLSPR